MGLLVYLTNSIGILLEKILGLWGGRFWIKNYFVNFRIREKITLMFKSEEREDIKNWGPITLLNVDYKIVANILAERLKGVLPNIISTNQKGLQKVGIFFRGIDYYRIS